MKKYNVGIIGYGNLGKALKKTILLSNSLSLKVIFTRRNPNAIETDNSIAIVPYNDMKNYYGQLDAVALAVGSKNDLIPVAIDAVKYFNTIDSYDDHKNIPAYFSIINDYAKKNNHLSLISCGWDPGLFSLMRGYFSAWFPYGFNNTFYGKGISQGHSDALRSINGVLNAVEFTYPNRICHQKALKGTLIEMSSTENLVRKCYIHAKKCDYNRIRQEINQMPGYFAGYKTEIHFVSASEVEKKKSELFHKGEIIYNIPDPISQLHFNIKTDSNPSFTASIMTAYMPCLIELAINKNIGAKTILDIPPSMLLPSVFPYL